MHFLNIVAAAVLATAIGLLEQRTFILADPALPAGLDAAVDGYIRTALQQRPEIANLRLEVSAAERFLNAPLTGHETAQGEPGVYRYHQYHGVRSDTFVLESLLAGAAYDVHLSRMKLRGVPVVAPMPIRRGPTYEPVYPRGGTVQNPGIEF